GFCLGRHSAGVEVAHGDLDVALDNDVICKAACYGLVSRFWPGAGKTIGIAILGTTRYVLPDAIDRRQLPDAARAHQEAAAVLAAAHVIEPSKDEVALAAEIELLAQQA